jgi:prolyl 4-hydroxylase
VLSSPTTTTYYDSDLNETFPGPYIVSIDDFLSEEEATTLIELGRLEGYQTSTLMEDEITDEEDPDQIRTSSNSWCSSPKCTKHDVTKAVLQRIYDLVQIPEDYSEWIQMLYYQEGQL